MLSITPLFIPAGILSFFHNLFERPVRAASTEALSLNSQTIPLLAPAVNLDPNPAKGGGNITVVDGAALLPEEGPSGTAADIEDWPTYSQVSIYVVRDGDTLSQIGELFDVSVNTIIWANDIKGGVIHPGDTLVILPITGLKHIVVKGETLSSIAKKFNSDATEIAQYNGVLDTTPLAAGTSIIIPHGEIAAAPAPTTSGSTSSAPPAPLHGAGGPDLGNYWVVPIANGIITQGLHGYNGIDVGAPNGTGIYAAAAGIVLVARSGGWNGGYGNYVVVQHDNGTQTLYAHASQVLVSAGDRVAQGQTIALVGNTGLATGYHLHFEVRGAKNPLASSPVGTRL